MSPGSRRALFFVAGIGTLLPVSTSAAAIPHSYTVVIDKMKFGPMPTQLRKGDAIIWIAFLVHSHIVILDSHLLGHIISA